MKKFISLIVLSLFISVSTTLYAQNNSLLEILNQKIGSNKEAKKEAKFIEVLNEVVTVNSVSNSRFNGGKNRFALKLNIPKGTTVWYYKVNVFDLDDIVFTSSINSLLYQLENNRLSLDNYSDKTVDFYVIPESNAANFMQTGNDNYLIYTEYTKKDISQDFGSSKNYKDDYWIGLKNNDKFKGVKVRVEVVALGVY
jgi:hypothetical protein